MNALVLSLIALVILGGGFFLFSDRNEFSIPSGTTQPFDTEERAGDETADISTMTESENSTNPTLRTSTREVLVTDGVKHSIPLNQILSGGPGKDGIPSIDDPEFVNVTDAEGFLNDTDVGLGLVVGGESRFYPYQILVCH